MPIVWDEPVVESIVPEKVKGLFASMETSGDITGDYLRLEKSTFEDLKRRKKIRPDIEFKELVGEEYDEVAEAYIDDLKTTFDLPDDETAALWSYRPGWYKKYGGKIENIPDEAKGSFGKSGKEVMKTRFKNINSFLKSSGEKERFDIGMLNPFAIKEAEAAEPIKWDAPKKSSITWDKPVKGGITWDKPPAKVGISWGKPTRGGITWGADKTENMSNFGRVLDILGRPGYAVKSVIAKKVDEIQEIVSRTDIDKLEKMNLLSQKKLDLKSDFETAWKGLSGQERKTANEIWEDIGVEGVPLLGFATELAADPLMYTAGTITRVLGKGIGLTKKGIQAVPGVTKAAGIIGAKVQPMTSALKDLFVTKTGIGKLGDLIETHLLKRQYLKGRELQFGVKTRNIIQNISRKTGQSIDDVERQIVNIIEQPQLPITGVVDETKALANTIKSHLSNLLTSEMKAGVPISSLSGGARNIQYFPRITTREAQQYLKQAKIGNAKIWNPKLANALRRKTGDFTLTEFNDFVAVHGLKSLGGRSIEEFFMKQPAYAVATRGVRSAKAVTSAQFLDDVGKVFGQKTAPTFWQELPDSITKLNPSLKGLKFDPGVMDEIARVTTSYFNPNEAKMFMRTFDVVQNTWKRWTLAPFPKYHLRNMIGNTWNNYLAGVNPKHYPRAQAVQMYRKYKNTTGTMNRVALQNLKIARITPQLADDIIMQAEKTAVVGRGWYAADIEVGIKRAIGEGGITARGMAFGSTIENNARLAHFMDRLEKGDDVMMAAKSVKKFLFDYGDLTAFEKQVMKRLMPFYTWTRKNVPLQLEQIWKQPKKFLPLGVPLRARNEEDLLRLKYARPQLYERLPIELRRTVDTVTYVPLEGLIPAGDLAKMARPQEMFLELITPYLRAPIELRMNKSFYFESEIQRYPNETQQLLRMDIPVKLKYTLTSVLPQARMLNELNKLVKKQIRKEKLTPGEQAFAQSLSSIYKVNLKDLRNRALRNIERKIRELKSGMFWAKRYERTEEGKRIKETYNELKKLMKKIKGY